MCHIMAARGIREPGSGGRGGGGGCAHFTHKQMFLCFLNDALLTRASFNHSALIFLPLTPNPGLPRPLTQCHGSPDPKAVGWG